MNPNKKIQIWEKQKRKKETFGGNKQGIKHL